jgi:hypothetical protein
MCVIFFRAQGPAIQVAVSKGESVHAKYKNTKVIPKVNRDFRKRRLVTIFDQCQIAA